MKPDELVLIETIMVLLDGVPEICDVLNSMVTEMIPLCHLSRSLFLSPLADSDGWRGVEHLVDCNNMTGDIFRECFVAVEVVQSQLTKCAYFLTGSWGTWWHSCWGTWWHHVGDILLLFGKV